MKYPVLSHTSRPGGWRGDREGGGAFITSTVLFVGRRAAHYQHYISIRNAKYDSTFDRPYEKRLFEGRFAGKSKESFIRESF
ncbi:hypothetical protein E2C01_027697 [Portunus trituberculatus]|uniref:Uncharacterized protein n=1 Tax=Portunus trituberculatus TaxID=210409 RepID=A0A5B7EJD2_PORTR|nr:hypothetical protein [Portunus trituberculatus]